MALFDMKGKIKGFLDKHIDEIAMAMEDYLSINIVIDEDNGTFHFTCKLGSIIICEYYADLTNMIRKYSK